MHIINNYLHAFRFYKNTRKFIKGKYNCTNTYFSKLSEQKYLPIQNIATKEILHTENEKK